MHPLSAAPRGLLSATKRPEGAFQRLNQPRNGGASKGQAVHVSVIQVCEVQRPWVPYFSEKKEKESGEVDRTTLWIILSTVGCTHHKYMQNQVLNALHTGAPKWLAGTSPHARTYIDTMWVHSTYISNHTCAHAHT